MHNPRHLLLRLLNYLLCVPQAFRPDVSQRHIYLNQMTHGSTCLMRTGMSLVEDGIDKKAFTEYTSKSTCPVHL